MSDKDDKGIVIRPEAQAQLDAIAAKDPEGAEMIRDMLARMRQAHHGWMSGQYPDFETALEALTGKRPRSLFGGDDDE